jgi:hypothetical protein
VITNPVILRVFEHEVLEKERQRQKEVDSNYFVLKGLICLSTSAALYITYCPDSTTPASLLSEYVRWGAVVNRVKWSWRGQVLIKQS